MDTLGYINLEHAELSTKEAEQERLAAAGLNKVVELHRARQQARG